MRLLRGLAGALLWIGASVVGLLGVVLCLTLILLPIGIPLLMIARRMFGSSLRLMLPRGLAHPVKELGSSARDRKDSARMGAAKAGDKVASAVKPKQIAKASRKATKQKRKKWRKRRKALGLDW